MSYSAEGLVERQAWLDGPSDLVQPAVERAFGAAGAIGPALKDVLHGVWLRHPLHPVLTDIPVGAWTTAIVLDTLDSHGHRRFDAATEVAIGVGLVGAAGAAVTGLTDWSDTSGTARRVGLAHGMLNVAATAMFGLSLWLRRRGRRADARPWSWTGYSLVVASAYLGGRLVYSHRIGTDRAAVDSPPESFTDVAGVEDVPEGQPVRVMCGGAAVLLVRRGTDIHAIGETCSHLGGPLSEGRLDGDTITCPWHGSTFKVTDGTVVHGPATHRQPVFEVRVRDGRIAVRQA